MFTKKKVLIFIISLVLFTVVDFWVFTNIKNSFDDIMTQQIRKNVSAAIESVPHEEGEIPEWIQTTKNINHDLEVLYLKGFEATEILLGEEMRSFFDTYKLSEDFAKGIESASYEEIYISPKKYEFKGRPHKLIFVPSIDHETAEFLGVGVFLYSSAEQDKFYGLLYILALSSFGIFLLVYYIGRFTRDPVLGYTILILFGIVLIFVAYPLFEAVRLSFIKEGRLSFEIWKNILTSKQYLSALWGSILLGICTATASTAIGFLFAFILTRTNIKGKKFFSAMATMPVISPPFSLTLSIILLFGNNGLITKQLLGLENFNIYGLGGLTLVQTMGMFPIAYLTMAGVMQAIDSTLEDAAMDLKANRWTTFKTITLPLATPGLLSSWLLVFTNSLADFANPLILSGNYRVLSVEAYIEVTGMNRLGNGAALSLLLLLPTLTAFFVQRYWVSRKSYVTVTGKPSGRMRELTTKPVKVTLVSIMSIIAAFLIGLYGTIVAGCFVKNWGIDYTFTLNNFKEALERGKDALIDTVTLSAVATPIAGILAMIVAVIVVRKTFIGKKALEVLIMTPFALPGTLVGISYILAFNKPPIILVGTAAIIIINYVIRELPVGVEGGIATLKQIDPSIEEAAQNLGADTPTIFRTIVLPLIRPAFISSLSYTFVRSMTAVSAIIFLISARWYHLTVLIYNFSENLRFGLASVLATTLIVIVFVAFGLMRLLVRKNENLEKNIRA